MKFYRTSFLIWVLTCLVLAVKWLSAASEALEFWTIVLLASASLTIFLRALVQWSSLRFDVCRDGISVEFGDDREMLWLAYANVSEIRFIHFSGWLAICVLKSKDGRTLRVPAFLQRSDYVLDLLAHARPDLASHPGFEAYRQTAISIDHGWARQAQRIEHWPQWLWFVGMRVLAALALTWVVVWFRGFSFDWETASFVAVYSLATLIFWEGVSELWQTRATIRRLRNDAAAVRRKADEERGIQKAFGSASWVIVLLVALAFALVTRPSHELRSVASEKTDSSQAEK